MVVTLIAIPNFLSFTAIEYFRVIQRFTEVTVVKGQTIINTGEEADCCYFIKEGRVEVRQKIADEMLNGRLFKPKVIFLVKKAY